MKICRTVKILQIDEICRTNCPQISRLLPAFSRSVTLQVSMSIFRKVRLRPFGLLLLACGLVLGQNTPASQSNSDSAKENQHRGDIGINVEQNPSPQKKAPERKISPEEAKALFASVDEIFKFASEDTGFVIKHPVKRELASRDVVQKYVESRLSDDEDAKRLERSEIVLKKFGLLPRDFDLHTFLVGLLREQV